jgi:hypothetical protein
MVCTLSKLDRRIREGLSGAALDHEMKVVSHFCTMANAEIESETRGLRWNYDRSVRTTADSVLTWAATLPNNRYSIPERTPVDGARGTGRCVASPHIPEFGSGSVFAGKKA